MNKLPYLLGTTAVALALAMPGTASAQNASAKATGAAQIGGVLFGPSGGFPDSDGVNDWKDVPSLSSSLKAPHGKELAIDVSLLCGVFTETKVKGKKGEPDTDSAGSKIKVRVKIEPDPFSAGVEGFAEPGGATGVTFCDRQQTLSAKLGGIITNLTACTGTTITEECVLEDEEITLGIKTLNANAFNFFALNLDSSDKYTLTVQAQLDTCKGTSAVTDEDPTIGDCETDGGDAESDTKAFGFITGGSMFVEEVRFIRDDSL